MAREKIVLKSYLSDEADVTVYHTGGDAHYVEARSVADGRLLVRRRFLRGRGRFDAADCARRRAIMAAESLHSLYSSPKPGSPNA